MNDELCIRLDLIRGQRLSFHPHVRPTTVLRVGGAGNKVLQLIDGQAHAYVFASPGCKKWDTCAPEAVLSAIGGTLTGKLSGSVYGSLIYWYYDFG